MADDLLALPLGPERPEAVEQADAAEPQRAAPPGVFSKPALAVALTEAASGPGPSSCPARASSRLRWARPS